MCADRTGHAEDPVIPEGWRDGEVAVIGIGTTGVAVSRFLAAAGVSVYASDLGTSAAVERAAHQLESRGVVVQRGGHDLSRITRAIAMVVSPGVPPNAPPVRAALDTGIEVWSEIDLASLALGSRRLAAVTGTNGKTTTTALIDHVLRHAGVASIAAGNIGTPLIDAVQDSSIECFVVELSSFQLHYSRRLTPTIGVLTNLAPDHMDWYRSEAAYYDDKRRLFMHATPSSCWVVNGDDPRVMRMVSDVAGRVKRFSLLGEADAWFDRRDGTMMLAGQEVIDRADYRLMGDHNVANALAAMLAAAELGVAAAAIRDGLRTVQAPPHRLETVRVHDGIRWVNDSKATNVASARAAVRAVSGDLILILGGRGKGEDFGGLAEVLGPGTHTVLAYGEAAELISRQLRGVHVEVVKTLDDAVSAASRAARAGDTVLLSPACASFDQYENYEHRGNAFRTLVNRL